MQLTTWFLSTLAPSFRSPSGITGWLARQLMKASNPSSTQEGIQRLALSSQDDIFVELGAGNGAGLQQIASQHPNIPKKIMCIEISQDFRNELEQIRGGLPFSDKVEIHPNDCKEMPFLKNDSVDKMFAMNVVYFLDPLPLYLQELNRVLKPGGTVVFGCKFGAVPKDAPVFVNIDKDKIVQQMEEANFDVTTAKIELGDPMKNYIEVMGKKKGNTKPQETC